MDVDVIPEPLRRRYVESLPGKAAALAAALESIANGDSGGAKALRDQAHKLAGSAGMYGFDDIGHLAREIVHSVDDGSGDTALTHDLIAILNAASLRFGV